jgi:hypothetical protein
VNHFATPEFWFNYRHLPVAVRAIADKNFDLLRHDPQHPSLRLKRIGAFWSARAGLRFWIGHHAEYEKLIKTSGRP